MIDGKIQVYLEKQREDRLIHTIEEIIEFCRHEEKMEPGEGYKFIHELVQSGKMQISVYIGIYQCIMYPDAEYNIVKEDGKE